MKEPKIMKNRTLKNILQGIAIALVAAYLFPVTVITLAEGPKSGAEVLFSLFPLYALLYVSWIVIPLGGALGMLIPPIANGKNRWLAALHGAGFGALAGLAAVFCFTSVFGLGSGAGVLWLMITGYCALWVGGYAFYRAKGPSLYR
jgi:hypothetical protein